MGDEARDEAKDVQSGDVIVLNKGIVIAAGLAVLIFIAGGAAGYFLAVSAFQYGADQALAQVGDQQVPAGPQIQPTDVPSRIEGVETDGDPQLGPDNAKVTIVEFSDFQCPFCRQFRDNTFDALIDKYGDDIRIVYRDYPLSSLHPEAQKAAEAAECANEQGKFWEMHDLLYEKQDQLSADLYPDLADQLGLDTQQFEECLTSGQYADEVSADLQAGTSYGVSGTPTFFVNGWILVGAQPTSQFETLIDQELGR
jgi:protein-disulfide isomerase